LQSISRAVAPRNSPAIAAFATALTTSPPGTQEQQSGTVINAAAAMRSPTDRDLNNWNFPEPGERL